PGSGQRQRVSPAQFGAYGDEDGSGSTGSWCWRLFGHTTCALSSMHCTMTGNARSFWPAMAPSPAKCTPTPSMVPPSDRSTSSAALRLAPASLPPHLLIARGSTSLLNTWVLLAGLAEEQGDVGVVAGVEQHVGPGALELDHERREIRRGGRVAFLEHEVEAGLARALLVALGHVDPVGAVLVDDGDLDVLRVLLELLLRVLGDEVHGHHPELRPTGLRAEHVLEVPVLEHGRGD